MKALFPALVFFLITAHVTAQDLIVTAQGDSIHCKITMEKDGFVYFMYIGGALSQYKINGQKVELDEDNRLGMSRVDISVGLRLLK